ncbi:hypothetical protein GCM10007298_11200 [Williamsia phyllosphaerae]|uniref:Uncharacterized protein n=1 Tax=Williamsia phyllosphaerae TaxID=885042 RepID=A0ABQ1UGL0_9NOCA|nr:hypothetical protein GCM10007298_11200 [Williamsia phyllosphaerae]
MRAKGWQRDRLKLSQLQLVASLFKISLSCIDLGEQPVAESGLHFVEARCDRARSVPDLTPESLGSVQANPAATDGNE